MRTCANLHGWLRPGCPISLMPVRFCHEMTGRSSNQIMLCRRARFGFAILMALPCAFGQEIRGFKNEYLDDFATTRKQLIQLAQAIPADKFDWKPLRMCGRWAK